MLESLNLNQLTEPDARALSAANLAYVGDAVYDVFIRLQLVLNYSDWQINAVNKMKVSMVKASMQAKIAKCLMQELGEVELSVLKRGRNTKTQSMPKNALLSDYRYATGFEALLGYLALSGQGERLNAVLETAWQLCNEEGAQDV